MAHGTLLNVMWQPEGRGVLGKMDTCVCIYMAESICCLTEIIITLFISYIPIQNLKFKKCHRKRD